MIESHFGHLLEILTIILSVLGSISVAREVDPWFQCSHVCCLEGRMKIKNSISDFEKSCGQRFSFVCSESGGSMQLCT